MTARNRSGRPPGGRLPNDPLDWVEEPPTGEESAVEGMEQVNDAPGAPAQMSNEGNESMSEAVKSEALGSGHTESSNQKLKQEVLRLVEASKNGQLSERANVAAFGGDDATLLRGLNEMLDAILLPIGEGNRILDQIAKGKIDELIAQTYQGDHEKMKQNVNGIASVLQKFQAEFAQLTEYSRLGQLEKRGNVGAFAGAYGEIIKGANEMLDAILLPIGEGNRILDQIAKGKIDELIAQTYQGDHEKMKQNVNGIAFGVAEIQGGI